MTGTVADLASCCTSWPRGSCQTRSRTSSRLGTWARQVRTRLRPVLTSCFPAGRISSRASDPSHAAQNTNIFYATGLFTPCTVTKSFIYSKPQNQLKIVFSKLCKVVKSFCNSVVPERSSRAATSKFRIGSVNIVWSVVLAF